MKVNELRIGNIIETPMGCQSIGGVCQAETPYIRLEGNMHIGYRLTNCKPIPLTEEILLKCGFEIKPDSALPTFVYNGRLDLQVEFMLGKYSFRIEVENRHTTFVRVVDYLHQLQNLYFAITGEELRVEL